MNNNVSTRKILILTANPIGTDRLRLDEEVRDIKEGLRQSKERNQFVIDSEWAVRSRDIRRTILSSRPHIVHFSGHGTEDGGLAFENEMGQVQLVQPDALAGLFRLLSEHVKCVMLNACYSKIQADAIVQHIDFVIGMKKGVGDRAAIEFAVGFYDALGNGLSIKTAYEFGCNAIQLAGISEQSTPVLQCKDDLTTIQDTANLNELNSVKDTTNCSLRPDTLQRSVYELVLTASIDEVNIPRFVDDILSNLQGITGDTSLTLRRIESGSVKLILEGTEEGFRLLEALIASGELQEILEIPIQRVSRLELKPYEGIEEDASDNLISNETVSFYGCRKQFNFSKLFPPLTERLAVNLRPLTSKTNYSENINQRQNFNQSRLASPQQNFQTGVTFNQNQYMAFLEVVRCSKILQFEPSDPQLNLIETRNSIAILCDS